MTFLQPWWWWLAALAVPLLLAHGARKKQLEVPSLRAWRGIAPSTTSHRSRPRRPRISASLVLQLLALLATVAALAGPRSAATVADHQVWVLDISASMGAATSGTTRLEQAIRFLQPQLDAVDEARRGGPLLSLVRAGTVSTVPIARATAKAAVRTVVTNTVADQGPDAEAWWRLADRTAGLLRPGERTRITILTDGAGAEAARQAFDDRFATERVQIDVLTFGEAVNNRGIAELQVLPVDPGSGRWRIEGQVVAHPPAEEPVTLEVGFARQGSDVEVPWKSVQLKLPTTHTTFSFETQVVGGGVLSLQLPSDALAADNRAHIALRESAVPLRVGIIGEAPDALLSGLASLNAAQVTVVPSVSALPQGESFDLTVVVGDAQAQSHTLPAKLVLWTAGASPEGHYELTGSSGAPVLDVGGSLSASFGIDPSTLAPGPRYRVPPLAGAATLLEVGGQPLLQFRERPGSVTDPESGDRAAAIDVVAAWDLGTGPWARELGFITFLAELGHLAQPQHGRWTEARCVVGRPCQPALATSAGLVGDALGMHQAGDARWTLDGLAGPESDLTTAAATTSPRPTPRALDASSDRWLAALAAVALILDGMLMRVRRRRGTPTRAASGQGTRGARRGPHAREHRGRRDRARLRAITALPGLIRRQSAGKLASIARVLAVASLILAALDMAVPVVRPSERTVVVMEPTRAGMEAIARLGIDAARGARNTAVVVAERDGRVVADFGQGWAPAGIDSEIGRDPLRAIELAAGLLGGTPGKVVLAGLAFPVDAALERLTDRLATRAVRVDALPSPAPAAGEAWIEALTAQSAVRTGESVEIGVRLVEPASMQARVRILADGAALASTGIASSDGGVALQARMPAGPPGVRTIRAELLREDPELAGVVANDVMTLLIDVKPAGRLAVVTPTGQAPRVLAARLSALGYDVVPWAPIDVPFDGNGLFGTDVVLLLDVPALDLHTRQQQALDDWVRTFGGGLLIAGAESAFGPGGYLQTPLDTLSPLSSRVPGEQPKVAVAFVIDRSGSMQQTAAGRSRLDVAKEATIAAVDLLHPDSEVAVVVFDDAATTLVPLGVRPVLAAPLLAVVPGGGTDLYPALEAAADQLARSEASARHIVVLTDGLSQPADFQGLADRIFASGITISTVGIGRGADANTLRAIARRGGGAFHATTDVRALPSILAQEAMLMSGDPVQDGATTPIFVGGEAAFVQNLPLDFPTIAGYVRTTLQPAASLHATVPSGDPLLASWRHGLGRVVALTTPLVGPWSEVWSSTPFHARLLGQLLRWLVPPVAGPGLDVRVAPDGDGLRIDALAIERDGAAREGLPLIAVVTPPQGEDRTPVALADLSGGRYRGHVAAFDMGAYLVTVKAVDGSSHERGLSNGASSPTTGDARWSATGLGQLSYSARFAYSAEGALGPYALTAATGGQVSWEAPTSGRRPGIRLAGTRDVRFWLVAGLLLGVLGVALTRLRLRRPVRR